MKPSYSTPDNDVSISVRSRRRLSENLVPVRRDSKMPQSAIGEIDFDAVDRAREEANAPQRAQDDELEVARQNANLAKAELQQFVNAVSHDLRTPLRAVIGFSELLNEEYSDHLDANGKDYVKRIVDGTIQIQKLINCVTEVSRIHAKHPEFIDVDLNEVFQNAADDLRQSIDESNAVLTSEALPTVFGDPMQLLQLFRNLLENSIRFCDDVPPQVHVSCEWDEPNWVLKVCDNGVGIAKKDHDNAFRMFRRIGVQKSENAGLGAGLTICRKIVERHGGEIELESEVGAGTKAIFSIAAANAPS